MPTNLRRLLAQAADADPLNTADADVQQMIADGIVIRRSKICPVKRKPVKAAYNTKTEEFYYNADGSAMTLRAAASTSRAGTPGRAAFSAACTASSTMAWTSP